MRLADTIEKQVELRRKVKSAMTYPVVVVDASCCCIVTAMLLFVIPMFQGIYKQLGGTLPAPTQILIDISNVVPQALVRRVRSSRSRRSWAFRQLDQLRRGPQALGRDQAEGAGLRQARRARPRWPGSRRTLSALVRSGVPILESLDIVAETAGNWVVSEAVRDTQQQVKRGEPLSQPARGAPGVPADGRADDGGR